MSRSGYSDDCENLGLWRGAVNQAIKGKRGQALLCELVAALDAMPEKRLVAGELEADGSFCALGIVGQARGLNLAGIDTYDSEALGKNFNIAEALAREVMYMNDEAYSMALWSCVEGQWKRTEEADPDAVRWTIMRKWASDNIAAQVANKPALPETPTQEAKP